MVTLEEVAGWAAALPEVTEGRRYGNRTWEVAGKAFIYVSSSNRASAAATSTPSNSSRWPMRPSRTMTVQAWSASASRPPSS